MIRTPLPRQQKQTHPLHALQRTFLLSCSLVVFPLYKSSKETLGCIISSPLLLPLRLLL
uniref:Uncharacterized protein n=1 Tax=Coturnix japonica TaxID=93934 RepID=A0A8C2TUN3_COTJA